MPEVRIPRLVVAGTHSGAGKTTVAVGLVRALRERGLTVQPFKAGPDYIDPTHLSRSAGRPCRNLDPWLLGEEGVLSLFAWACRGADIAVIEGVMGLYDGARFEGEGGSTAHLARLLSAPVVAVLDIQALGRTAGALALGLLSFAPDLPLAGWVLNRAGGPAHGRGCAGAVESATRRPVFGWLPRDPALEVPERHLGLVPSAEPGDWDAFTASAGRAVAEHLDLDALLGVASSAPLLSAPPPPLPPEAMPMGGTVAVARDPAFSFLYPETVDLLSEWGARPAFFSPLEDGDIPPEAGAVLLSGGFPEVYARGLAENAGMRRALRRAVREGLPVYAECGGLMYLTEALVDAEGRAWPMVGALPGRSVMTPRLTLGYRVAHPAGDSWLLRRGETVRGHEFHYSVWEGRPPDLPPAYHLEGDPSRPEGARLGNLVASYVHLHPWAFPALPQRIAETASRRRARAHP